MAMKLTVKTSIINRSFDIEGPYFLLPISKFISQMFLPKIIALLLHEINLVNTKVLTARRQFSRFSEAEANLTTGLELQSKH